MIIFTDIGLDRSLNVLARFRLFSEIPIAGLSNIKRSEMLLDEEIAVYTKGVKGDLAAEEGFKVVSEVDEPSIILGPRLIITQKTSKLLAKMKSHGEAIYVDRNGFLFGVIEHGNIEEFISKAPRKELNMPLPTVDSAWDMIEINRSDMFIETLKFISSRYSKKKEDVYVGDNVEIESGVVFNVSHGPVIIDNDSYIQGPSRIEGPTYIGSRVTLAACSNIRRSYIGTGSTVGGEINRTVIFRYSNSRHQSYIGDSYIGEFVNIGALTAVSNLKNTFGLMKFKFIDGSKVDTGYRKIGVLLADHVKISIGTIIYGGIYIDVFSHAHFRVTRSLPPFTIWYEDRAYELELDSAIRTAERMARSKGVKLSQKYLDAIKHLFHLTSDERNLINVTKGKIP